MRDGNKNNGFLTSSGYKNTTEQYFLRTGLRHSRQQLKNRWQQLKRGTLNSITLGLPPLPWLDQFEIMYEHVAIDGSTSCIPGEDTIKEDEEEDNDDSPMENSRKKGGNNTSSCATSPRKRSRMPMPKIMKGIWDTM
ncbi:hypothetical protein BS78_02G244700 [Paspalum vaginatum]|nr:hypothetical protein BS78_02G244700 [Paspalum vaginatum]